MRKLLFAAALLLCLCSCERKGFSAYSWEYHELDASYDRGGNAAVQEAIAKYDSLMGPLQEIVCYSKAVYDKEAPESAFSNFAADALRQFAEEYSEQKIDIGLLNFGGIRAEMPKGAVRVYDMMSIFPFENFVTVLDVEGSGLKRMFNKMASRGDVEVLSGVRLKIDDTNLVECLVGGKPIDAIKIYSVATIDFLVTGGDGIDFGNSVLVRCDTNVLLRDAITYVLRKKLAAGETLDLKRDGRIVMINQNK